MTEYVSYGEESLIREHAKSRLKANLWLTGPIGFCWAFPWRQRRDLFDRSINTSHSHSLNFCTLAARPDNQKAAYLPYLHMHSDNKAALSSKSPVSVIRERCHPTVGICLPVGIYPYTLLKAKLCGVEAGDAFKMLCLYNIWIWSWLLISESVSFQFRGNSHWNSPTASHRGHCRCCKRFHCKLTSISWNEQLEVLWFLITVCLIIYLRGTFNWSTMNTQLPLDLVYCCWYLFSVSSAFESHFAWRNATCGGC